MNWVTISCACGPRIAFFDKIARENIYTCFQLIIATIASHLSNTYLSERAHNRTFADLGRLHVRKSNVFILTPKTVVTVGVWAVAYHSRYGFCIQDEAMDVARSAPQGAHYHVDDIYLWDSELSLHQLGYRPKVYTQMGKTPLHSFSIGCHQRCTACV